MVALMLAGCAEVGKQPATTDRSAIIQSELPERPSLGSIERTSDTDPWYPCRE